VLLQDEVALNVRSELLEVIAMNLIESSNPFTRDRGDAPARWLLDILWLVLASGEDTNGEYSVIEQYMPVGSGPIPHIHPYEDEAFYVLSGEMTAIIGGQKVVLGRAAWATSRGTSCTSSR
jgi:quercetin dioxygenase-like cupin family protein